MAIVLPQGRLNNTNDLFIRNFLFCKARLLAVVGLHGNTFKPHTGAKTSVVFLQKYTQEELDHIRKVQNRHAAEWDNHLAELTALSERAELTEEDLPPLLFSFLQAEFEEGETSEGGESGTEEVTEVETDEELLERIENLQAQLAALQGRAKGEAELKRALPKHGADWRCARSKVSWSIYCKTINCSPAIVSHGWRKKPPQNWITRFSLPFPRRAARITAASQFIKKTRTASSCWMNTTI